VTVLPGFAPCLAARDSSHATASSCSWALAQASTDAVGAEVLAFEVLVFVD